MSRIEHNLRHLRVFLAVVDHRSATVAAETCHVSQPAVSQALGKLERQYGVSLFQRTAQGLDPTKYAAVLAHRVRRAFRYLDLGLNGLSPRLRLTATVAQLNALIAVRQAENTILAARKMGVAQPTIHRSISQLEKEAGRQLFERTSHGLIASKAGAALAAAAQLAFAELAQAEADLAEAQGGEAGQIVIGAMPLSRSQLLPRAITRFRISRPQLPIRALIGSYDELLAGLRRGEIDFLIGALRDPPPIGDIEQKLLFYDSLVLVSRSDHPLVGNASVGLDDLAAYPWVVSHAATPTRRHFDRLFAGTDGPLSVVESSSLILMRQLLIESDHLGCISRHQAEVEVAYGLMAVLPVEFPDTRRPIGITVRADWAPTAAQQEMLDALEATAQEFATTGNLEFETQ